MNKIDTYSSVRAHLEGDKIILEPMVEIPAREKWLYQNKIALNKVKAGLTEKGTIKRGSFVKYAPQADRDLSELETDPSKKNTEKRLQLLL